MLEYRPDIDGLRAAAILPVVLFHAGLLRMSGGFIGVDVFFVISGYLITGILLRELHEQRFSLVGFYERRARRILPVLFIVVAASFIASYTILLPDEFVSFAKSALATTAFVSNIWFWRESSDYFAESTELAPLLQTWSLAIEEQFYIVFPFLLVALTGWRKPVTMKVVAAFTALSLALSIYGVIRAPSATFYLAPTRGWELGLGALLALGAGPRLAARWLREVIAASGLVAILFAAFFFDREMSFPGLTALVPCLGAAALIHAGAAGPSRINRFLAWRPIVFVGLISYSLYLWHWPILAFLRVRLASTVLPIEVAVGAVAAAFALAIFSWALIERPFRIPGYLSRSAVFTIFGASLAVVIASSVLVLASEGVRSRIPKEAYNALEAKIDWQDRPCSEKLPSDGLCQLGAKKEGAIDFVFWGDSHAEALRPALDIAARRADRTGIFISKGLCPPLLGAEIVAEPGCKRFNNVAIEEIQRRYDVGMVILAARWAIYKTSETFGNEPGLAKYITDAAHTTLTPETNAIVFDISLRRTLEALMKSGKEIVIIGSAPEIGWHVPRAIYARARWGDKLPTPPDDATVATRNASVAAAFDLIAKDYAVRVVPVADILCAPKCIVVHDGHPVYADDDHLSVYGARKLLAAVLTERIWGPTNLNY